MTALIYFSLSVVSLSALLFGALFFMRRWSWYNATVAVVAGLVFWVFDYFRFSKYFGAVIDRSNWFASADQIGVYAFTSMISVLAFSFIGAAVFAFIRQNKNKTVYVVLLISVLTMGFDFYRWSRRSPLESADVVQLAEDIVRAEKLNPELIQKVIDYDISHSDRSMMDLLLSHGDCPLELLQSYSTKDEVEYKKAILKNLKTPAEIVNRLAQDRDDIVRYYAASHPSLGDDQLTVLLKDSAKEVRQKADSALNKRRH